MVLSLLVVSHLSPTILKVKTQGFLLYPESVLMDLISSSGDIMYLNVTRLAGPMMLSWLYELPPFLTTQIHLYSFLMQHQRPLKIPERKTQLLSKRRNVMQTWLALKNLLPWRCGLFLPLDLSKCRSCCLAACCRWTTSARSAPVHRDFILCSYHVAVAPTRGEERVTGATGTGVFSPTTHAVVGEPVLPLHFQAIAWNSCIGTIWFDFGGSQLRDSRPPWLAALGRAEAGR